MASSTPGSVSADELAVRRVLERYFACVDGQDRAGYADVFAPDVVIDYFDGEWRVEGVAALIDATPPTFRSSIHVLANATITLDGDRADADTSAVAHLLIDDGRAGSPGTVVTRGLRYVDELVRLPVGWRITRRRHIPLWQTDQPATRPAGAAALRR